MTDGPTKPPQDRRDSHARRRGVVNADVPSKTLGLPEIGEGASAAHFARDAVSLNAGEGHEDTDGPGGPNQRAD